MNEQLIRAEDALVELLRNSPNGLTMDEIIRALTEQFAEPELRAAVWTLKARGLVEFANGKLHQHAVAA